MDALEDGLALSYTAEHTVAVRTCTTVSELLLKGIESFHLHENLHTGWSYCYAAKCLPSVCKAPGCNSLSPTNREVEREEE